MLHVELKCKSFNRLSWSHDLHAAMTTLYILKMQLNQLSTHRNMQSQIANCQKQVMESVLLPTNFNETNSALRLARQHCRQVASEARTLRKTREDEQLAAFKLANSKQDPQKLEHQFFCTLETKAMFCQLPNIKPKSSGGLSVIKVPDPPTANPKTATNWTTIANPLLVKGTILARNQCHFGQAASTPLATAAI
jgi:hypothetical protein